MEEFKVFVDPYTSTMRHLMFLANAAKNERERKVKNNGS